MPLFVCHANCCRSVLAAHLYGHLCGGLPAPSAGFEPGERTSDRALAMLALWGLDASAHRPQALNRGLCEAADAIFVMAPPYLRRLLLTHGSDLATKAYLYADPFNQPESLAAGELTVSDPSFDARAASDLVESYGWMPERAGEIHAALVEDRRRLIPAADYLDRLESVDPRGH